MPRATTEAPSLADGPTLASTRDYWILHLRSEAKSERTISTYLRALDRLDAFLVERDMPRALGAIRRPRSRDIQRVAPAQGHTGRDRPRREPGPDDRQASRARPSPAGEPDPPDRARDPEKSRGEFKRSLQLLVRV